MSQFTAEEWDKIIAQANNQVEHADQQAANADEQMKIHMTPIKDDHPCTACNGTGKRKEPGLFFSRTVTCFACHGEGYQVHYNSPGDPIGWRDFQKRTNPAIARHNLRQTMIKRFVDLNPDHPMSTAIKAGLISNSDSLLPVQIDYSTMTTISSLTPLDTPVRLLNGQSYGFDVWGTTL